VGAQSHGSARKRVTDRQTAEGVFTLAVFLFPVKEGGKKRIFEVEVNTIACK